MYQSPNFVKVDTKVKDVFANYAVTPKSCAENSVTLKDGSPVSYTAIGGAASAICFDNESSL